MFTIFAFFVYYTQGKSWTKADHPIINVKLLQDCEHKKRLLGVIGRTVIRMGAKILFRAMGIHQSHCLI